jgi:hypothetical protein
MLSGSAPGSTRFGIDRANAPHYLAALQQRRTEQKQERTEGVV